MPARELIVWCELKVQLAKRRNAVKTMEIDDICKTMRISRSTFYRSVRL